MAFVVVNDQSGECSITLFPKTYRQYAKYLEKNNVLYIEGKAEEGLQEEKQLIVNKIEDASDLSKKSSFDKLFIRVQTDKEETETLTEMHHILKAEAGNVPVILFYVESNKKIVLNDTEWVTISEGLLSRLEELLGKQNIVWQKGT